MYTDDLPVNCLFTTRTKCARDILYCSLSLFIAHDTNTVIVYYIYDMSTYIKQLVLLFKLRNATYNYYYSFNLSYFSKF
jgi:hypothetical protein